MLRRFRETGGDPVYILLTWASKLRRDGRWLTLAAALLLAAVLVAAGLWVFLLQILP